MYNQSLVTLPLSPSLPSLRCPPAVRVVGKSAIENDADRLLPAEAAFTATFSDKRLREFRLGRACAHELLAIYGYAGVPVCIGKARQPVWPGDLVGSISHAGDIAVCAMAPKHDLAGVGIDIEGIEQETFDLFSLVTSSVERASIVGLKSECSYLAKLLFSAKESVFKCQYPLTGSWLEFGDISLQLDFENRLFSTSVHDQNKNLAISGSWTVTDLHIVTAAWILIKN